MIQAFLCVAALLLFSATTFRGQEPKVITTTISEPASVSIETLFAQADLVAFVKVQSGDAENYEHVIYKAVAVQSYKGLNVADVIYFTPFTGYAVGNEYLVFLKKVDKRVGDIVSKESESRVLPYDRTRGFYRIMYEGYSVMPVSYECAFEAPSHDTCDYAIKVNTKQVKLPARLKAFPADSEDPDISHVSFVKRKVIETILESLRRDNK